MLRILHTNDFHGALNAARESRLIELRRDCDVYFDCGDAIKSGNLAIPIKPEEAWTRLAHLHCTASVSGNRESHVLQSAFAKKLAGHRHPILCANLRLKASPPIRGAREGGGFQGSEPPLPGHLIVEASGLRIGVVGVMVPMVTERMATQVASAYLWDPPIPVATREAEALRPQVDCLIALTHIGLRQDRELAFQCSLFDLILGGHSHDVLTQPEMVGKTAICQTGSHGRFAGRYDWSPAIGIERYELVAIS
ncbi:MAG: metallophosphoesterase [Fimbriimonadales bacterium]